MTSQTPRCHLYWAMRIQKDSHRLICLPEGYQICKCISQGLIAVRVLLTHGPPPLQLRGGSGASLEGGRGWLRQKGSPRQGCPRKSWHMRCGDLRVGRRLDQGPPGLLVLFDHWHIHSCSPRPQLTQACNRVNTHSTQVLFGEPTHLHSSLFTPHDIQEPGQK